MTDDGSGIETAKKFLSRCHLSSSETVASTTLMSLCIRWARANSLPSYVSSYDLIAAATMLGFRVDRCRPPSNIGLVYVKKADVTKLRVAVEKHETKQMRDAIG